MMKAAIDNREKSRWGARVVASFLLAGGLLGLVGSAPGLYHSVQLRQVAAGISGILSIGLFAWCISTGISVWRIEASGLKRAKLLFAIQVPVFTVERFSYEFSTFFSLRVMIGNTTRRIGANIGSSSNLNLLPHPSGLLFGINIVAVLVLLYLIRASRIGRRIAAHEAV
jgi:hypothetical protein